MHQISADKYRQRPCTFAKMPLPLVDMDTSCKSALFSFLFFFSLPLLKSLLQLHTSIIDDLRKKKIQINHWSYARFFFFLICVHSCETTSNLFCRGAGLKIPPRGDILTELIACTLSWIFTYDPEHQAHWKHEWEICRLLKLHTSRQKRCSKPCKNITFTPTD